MKKLIASILAMGMLVSMAGCGVKTVSGTATDETASEESTTVSGVIAALDGTTVTLTCDDGSETVFTVTDDTVYSYDMSAFDAAAEMPELQEGDQDSAMTQSGEAPEMPEGDMQQDGNAPEMPEGDMQQDGNAPEMPEGDMQQDGNAPEMPEGDMQQDGNAPEIPSGDGQSDAPEKPEGEGQSDASVPEKPEGDGQMDSSVPEKPEGDQAPEQPEGDMQQGGEASEMPSGENQGEAPELPDGESQGEAPELPDGESQGEASEMPENGEQSAEMPQGDMQQGGEMPEASFDQLTIGTSVTATVDAKGNATEVKIQPDMSAMGGNAMGGAPSEMGGDAMGEAPSGMGGAGGEQSADISYTAANTFSESDTTSGMTYASTGTDENAVLVTGGEVALEQATVTRTSEDSTGGDNASFYGVGAAVLTTGGTVSVSNSTITTDANGGAGIFAYGDGTAYVSDTTITTSKNTSGGVHVAGGGTLYGWDLTVETAGESSAAIRSDRGSGTMVIDGGSYTSKGTGSPAIYSTADITVNGADLNAENSEAICIEGQNSIRLFDCDLTGNMPDDEQNDTSWNVILYQSMSGDAEEGEALFEMVGGSITAENGGMFYTTNTASEFILSGVEITNAEDNEFFLRCTGNNNARGWGNTGNNGAQCTFTAINQEMTGDVIWDSISTLDFYMTEGSTLTGAFLQDETYAGEGGDGYASLTIADGCTWVVTENSVLTSLQLEGSIVDENGNTVTVVGTDGTVYVQGTSSITVTVESFSETADLSGCGTVGKFEDYKVEKI